MKHLEGINPAILTLFNEDYSVDYEGMKALLDFLMDAKVKWGICLWDNWQISSLL